ncbi:hypothetical protein [Rhodopila sp.]|jgi:hypothetical protein|uniref:hypothetical protein n=1 Tax=Rhodopila sp. TaxID=2480087 RepID=UPI002BF02F6A|nr:hypothetical protein [Rhodopila sp.]HVZ09329.1 hypothetical protein [Rhodopila sp.]
MADISDVEQALADAVSGVLYPQGISSGSIIGTTCRIYRGWPNALTLNSDLSAGAVNVTVFSDNEVGRLTTRYMDDGSITRVNATMAIETTTQAFSITGNPTTGTVAGVLIDGTPYVYRVEDGDTAPLVAANLCSLIQSQRPAVLDNSTVSVPGSYRIIGRAVCDAKLLYEVRRQEKNLRLVFWCPAPLIRDSITSAVDLALSQRPFLMLADGASARLEYRNTATYDQSQNALLYRRDLEYTAEYPTLVSTALPALLFGGVGINASTTFG